MKLIIAVIKPFKLEEVREKLTEKDKIIAEINPAKLSNNFYISGGNPPSPPGPP